MHLLRAIPNAGKYLEFSIEGRLLSLAIRSVRNDPYVIRDGKAQSRNTPGFFFFGGGGKSPERGKKKKKFGIPTWLARIRHNQISEAAKTKGPEPWQDSDIQPKISNCFHLTGGTSPPLLTTGPRQQFGTQPMCGIGRLYGLHARHSVARGGRSGCDRLQGPWLGMYTRNAGRSSTRSKPDLATLTKRHGSDTARAILPATVTPRFDFIRDFPSRREYRSVLSVSSGRFHARA